MVFYVRGLSTELREKYGERLYCIEGAIGVLEELIIKNMDKKKRKEELKEGEYVFNNDNFNQLYDAVLRVIDKEEKSEGYSAHRDKLDKVDKKLDELTRDVRAEVREIEEKRDKECIGPHNPDKNYVKMVFHLPVNISDTMRVG